MAAPPLAWGGLRSLCVFHRGLGSADEAASPEEQAARLLFYHPAKHARERQLSHLGLLEGLLDFARTFAPRGSDAQLRVVELRRERLVFLRVEAPHVWMAAAAAKPLRALQRGHARATDDAGVAREAAAGGGEGGEGEVGSGGGGGGSGSGSGSGAGASGEAAPPGAADALFGGGAAPYAGPPLAAPLLGDAGGGAPCEDLPDAAALGAMMARLWAVYRAFHGGVARSLAAAGGGEGGGGGGGAAAAVAAARRRPWRRRASARGAWRTRRQRQRATRPLAAETAAPAAAPLPPRRPPRPRRAGCSPRRCPC